MAVSGSDTVHFDVALSQSANTAIESIASAHRIDPAEVLSRAVKLFIAVESRRREGETVGLLDADKKPVAEFVGI